MENLTIDYFHSLPMEVQEKIKDTLEAYDNVYLTFEHGIYWVKTGIMVKSEYSKDHQFIGVFNVNTVFSENDKIVNYVNNFHSYPTNYNGVKDWELMSKLRENGYGENALKVRMDENGNIVLV